MANKNTKGSSVCPNHCTNEETNLDKVSSSSKKNKDGSVEANVKSLGIGFLNINDLYDDAEVEFEDKQGKTTMNKDGNEKSSNAAMLGNTIIVEKDLQFHRIGSLRCLGYNDGISAVSLSERFTFNLSSRLKLSFRHKNKAPPCIGKRILNWAKFKRHHSKH